MASKLNVQLPLSLFLSKAKSQAIKDEPNPNPARVGQKGDRGEIMKEHAYAITLGTKAGSDKVTESISKTSSQQPQSSLFPSHLVRYKTGYFSL